MLLCGCWSFLKESYTTTAGAVSVILVPTANVIFYLLAYLIIVSVSGTLTTHQTIDFTRLTEMLPSCVQSNNVASFTPSPHDKGVSLVVGISIGCTSLIMLDLGRARTWLRSTVGWQTDPVLRSTFS